MDKPICPKTGRVASVSYINLKCRCIVCREWRKRSTRRHYLHRRDSFIKQDRAQNPDKYYFYYVKCSYGVTQDEYYKLLKSQGNCCAICESHFPAVNKGKKSVVHFFIDHDHETGIIRGLLCDDCNLALGRFKDSPELLRKAAHYLDVKIDRISGKTTRLGVLKRK